jgi:hypothetical protein
MRQSTLENKFPDCPQNTPLGRPSTVALNLNRRVRNQEDVFTGRKVPPLLAKVGMNKAPSARQGGT